MTRELVAALVERFREATKGLAKNIRNVVDNIGRIDRDCDESSALKRWMDALGG